VQATWKVSERSQSSYINKIMPTIPSGNDASFPSGIMAREICYNPFASEEFYFLMANRTENRCS